MQQRKTPAFFVFPAISPVSTTLQRLDFQSQFFPQIGPSPGAKNSSLCENLRHHFPFYICKTEVTAGVVVEDLELEVTGSIDGVLADGSQVELSTYHCQLNWFGRVRDLEVIANSGQAPLLGVSLLLAKELRVDYTNLELTLELEAKRASP